MRVILCSKTFKNNTESSHVGLGISATGTIKVLRANGINAEIWQVGDLAQFEAKFKKSEKDANKITHVIFAALWVPTKFLNDLCVENPEIDFAINCHSNIGFLSADPGGMKLLREAAKLEMGVHNFRVCANSEKMVSWFISSYGHPCAFLPNLYYLDGVEKHHRTPWSAGQILRIGCFGAIRPYKNLATSVGAAIEIGRELKVKTEIYISSGRVESGPSTVLNTVKAMVQGLPTTTLHESGWLGWPDFRILIGSMNLLMQASFTESFNLVTADGIAEGVPSVVSEAISWVPEYWKANSDDTSEVAHVGRLLLLNPRAPSDGLKSLEKYISNGIQAWEKFLKR